MSRLERLEQLRFSEDVVRRIQDKALACAVFLVLFTYFFRGSHEFWSVLVGAGLSLANFVGLSNIVRRLVDSTRDLGRPSSAPGLWFVLKTSLLGAATFASVVLLKLNLWWFILGLTVMVLGVFMELGSAFTGSLLTKNMKAENTKAENRKVDE